MRILLVSDHDFLPDRVGGRESSMDELANLLVRRGHEVAVLARAKTRNTRRPIGEIYWPVLYEIERVANVFGAAERHLANGKYDFAIYSVRKFPEHMSAMEDIRRRQILYVRDATEIDEWTFETFADSQVLIANSDFVAERVRDETGLSPHLVWPIVDFAKYRVPEIGREVTFINPVAEKGAELAFQIAERNPDIPFRFVLCWDLDSGEIRDLEERAKALGNVTIAEARLDARLIYSTTRLLLVPSRWEEGFGRVVLEAQCNGIPVIASARGGLPEAVGDGGILLDADADPDEWSDALDDIWNDQAAWNELSGMALARAEAFEAEAETNILQLEKILGQISSRASRLPMPVAKCAAILLPGVDGSEAALQSMLDQNGHYLEIVALLAAGQAEPNLEEENRGKVSYRPLDEGRSLSAQVFDIIRDVQCAFVVLLRPGDLVDPDFVYALSNAHLNSFWTAAVAECDAGVVNRNGDHVISSTSNFKALAADDSRLAAFENHRDTFGLSALAMPWETANFGRLPIGMMFRRDALLLLDNPPPLNTFEAMIAYFRQGAHLVGGTIYVDRVLCWSAEPDDELIAMLPYPADGNMSDALWDVIVAQLVENDVARHLKPIHLNRTLFGHLPKQRVLSLCERHPVLRDLLMKAFFEETAMPSPFVTE